METEQLPMEGEPFSPYYLWKGKRGRSYRRTFTPLGLLGMNLSALAKLTWGVLSLHSGRNGACFPSQETLADELNVNLRTIQRALDELKKSGLIKVNSDNKRRIRYEILFDSRLLYVIRKNPKNRKNTTKPKMSYRTTKNVI
jgi:DNA-binding transcriptional regulator YhcF (GntR family)